METESRYFSEEFTRSLLLSDPVVTVECWLTLAYQWLFVDSGFLGWLNAPHADQGNDFTRTLNGGAAWLLVKLREYLLGDGVRDAGFSYSGHNFGAVCAAVCDGGSDRHRGRPGSARFAPLRRGV